MGLADPETFDRLARTHRRELHAHCYRMLGSLLDAEEHGPGDVSQGLAESQRLGFWVPEVAYQLESSPASVNSARQRARSALERRRPGGGEPGLSPLDPRRRRLLERYVASWESGDLDGLMTLLTEDVVLSMPPMPEWFAGRESGRAFFDSAWGPTGPGPFRLRPIRANAQPAFGLYGRDPEATGYTPQAIQVLSLDGDRIARLYGIVRPDLFSAFELPLRLDEVDPRRSALAAISTTRNS